MGMEISLTLLSALGTIFPPTGLPCSALYEDLCLDLLYLACCVQLLSLEGLLFSEGKRGVDLRERGGCRGYWEEGMEGKLT